MLDFLCQIEFLLHNMLKLLKIPDFSRFFVQNSKFKKKSQFLDFLMAAGEVATLMIF